MVTPTSPQRVVVTRSLPAASKQLLMDATPALELDVWDSDTPMPRDDLLKRLAAGADALLCVLTDKIDGELLDAAGSRLKLVSTISVGFNHIDLAACKARGVAVTHTPGVLTETVADTAVGLVLSTCRRFKEAAASVADGSWGTWALLGMCGQDVHHATVGVIGLGRIGFAVAKRLAAFDCKILYSDMRPMPEIADKVGAEYAEMDDLLQRADIVIALCPLLPETTGLFNKDKFKLMKKTGVFINPARGELVNQDDLYEALTTGEIFGAGLDVTVPEPIDPNHKLVKLPNCFILPHIGSASMNTRTDMASLGVKNVLAAFKGEDLITPVKL